MNHISFIWSCVDEHLGWLHFLTIVNVEIICGTLTYPRVIFKNGSCGSCIFSFFKISPHFCSDCSSLHLHQQYLVNGNNGEVVGTSSSFVLCIFESQITLTSFFYTTLTKLAVIVKMSHSIPSMRKS